MERPGPGRAPFLRRQGPERLGEVEQGRLEDVAGLLLGSDHGESCEHLVREGLQPLLEISNQLVEGILIMIAEPDEPEVEPGGGVGHGTLPEQLCGIERWVECDPTRLHATSYALAPVIARGNTR